MLCLATFAAILPAAYGQSQLPRSANLSIKPPSLPTLSRNQQFPEPCAKVSASWAAQATGPITRENRVQVPAQVAYDCLRTVPVDIEGDLKEIEELVNFLQFQSTLSYLKDGHENHNSPLDLLHGLEEIARGVQKGTYQNDFEVQHEIHALLRSAGDFHLRFQPDMLEVFLYVRDGGQIVSISTTGTSLPELYLYTDLATMRNSGSAVSPLRTINGKDAIQYLNDLSTHAVYHDADARYNSFFANPAAAAVGMDSGGQFVLTQGLFDGPQTLFEFTNGSKKTVENVAVIREYFNFTDVIDGASFFAKFCQGPPTAEETKISEPEPVSTATVTRDSTLKSTPTPTGYPQPYIMQSGLSVQGYHLNGTGYKDVAILALPNFGPISEPTTELSGTFTGFLEAQDVLRTFFADSIHKGKSKLVIDLRGNSGGTIDMAFELFRQLFPDIEPYGASRYRAHEAYRLYSAAVADLSENHTFAKQNPKVFRAWAGGPSNYKNILNADGLPFKSFDEYFGPYLHNNDTFTAARRYDFSNHAGGHTLAPEVNVTGYDPERPPAPQPFMAENMVILQDGFCSSACAIFAQLMQEQGRVQTIAVGGRPLQKPMQGMGGTKGAQLLPFDSIIRHMNTTVKIAEIVHGSEAVQKIKQTAVGKLLNTSQLYIRSAHHNPSERIYGAVNALDNLRQNDTSETPLEFVYQAADCRLFYTVESVLSPIPLWEMAVDAKWGNGMCVDRSMGDPTAISTIHNEPFNKQQMTRVVSVVHVSSAILVVVACMFALAYLMR